MSKHYEMVMPLEARFARICDKENLLIAVACDERDAPFIVRACNSHDALVKALKDLFFEVEIVAEYISQGTLDAAEAALAAAEAQS